jgi:serine phosphatase RsbU (regulator of sigma subunit)
VASGGISASIILFARRVYLLVPALAVCFYVVMNGSTLASAALGQSAAGPRVQPATVFPTDERRMLIGLLAMGLIATGYVGFIIVLSTEGSRRTRLETEVAIAQRIQESILPSGTLTLSWGEAAGRTIPAAEVGGDFYDTLKLPDGRLLLFLADVAGHGVGAGILAAMTKSAVHLQASLDPSPGQVLSALNRTLHEISDRRMFVTAACALLDADSGRLCVATAGHPPVLLRSSEGITELRTPSLGLGMKAETRFEETTFKLQRSDLLFLYSDGLIERTNREGEQYDLTRLKGAVQALAAGPVAGLVESIFKDGSRFAGRTAQRDDVTLLVARVF